MRFQLLLHWSYLLLFLAIAAPWFIWAQIHFPGFLAEGWTGNTGLTRWQFLLLNFAWWFPAIFLILPGLLFAPRKIIRPQEFSFADALPLCWAGLGILPLLLIGGRDASSSMSALPAFALFAACAWERTSRPFRITGIALVLLVGIGVAAIAWFNPPVLGAITSGALPDAAWLFLPPMMRIALLSLLIFSLPAFYLVAKQRAEIALFLVLGSMVPIGFCLAESASRVAPFFSLADAADFLNPRLGESGQVFYEGPLRTGSSLSFYLNKKFFLVNQAPGLFEKDADAQNKYLDEHFVLEAWDRSNPIYFIIEENRVSHWRRLITDRIHIYHQVTTCGSRVVLSNQL
jgi:hypothetical protein